MVDNRIAEIKTRCEAARICSEKYLSGEWTTQTDAQNCAEDNAHLLNLLAERDAEIVELRRKAEKSDELHSALKLANELLSESDAEIERLTDISRQNYCKFVRQHEETERLREAIGRYCRKDCYRDTCAGNEDVGIPDCSLARCNQQLPAASEKKDDNNGN